MESREDIPRVSVGTVQDWQRLRSNYREAALAQFQIVQESLNGEGDAILAHLDKFIERTFTLAQPNLRVNGHNFELIDENGREMEAFDESLDRLIWSLADNRLKWYKRIAETRRTVPREIEVAISTLLEQHRGLDGLSLPPLSAEEEEEAMLDENGRIRIEDTLLKVGALTSELNQTVDQQLERAGRVTVAETELKNFQL